MEDHIIITPEMLEKASDYIPLLERQEMLESIARVCVVKVKMEVKLTGSTETVSMPERYQEHRIMTKMCLMGVLALKYLHVDYDGDDRSLQMPANIYDQWAGSHVLNQIEKLKSDKTVGEKAFRILKDYRDFCNDLYREIDILLGHQNDVVYRLMDAMNGSIQQTVMSTMTADVSHAGKPPEKMSKEEREQYVEQTVKRLNEGIEQLQEMKERIAKAKEGVKHGAK